MLRFLASLFRGWPHARHLWRYLLRHATRALPHFLDSSVSACYSFEVLRATQLYSGITPRSRSKNTTLCKCTVTFLLLRDFAVRSACPEQSCSALLRRSLFPSPT